MELVYVVNQGSSGSSSGGSSGSTSTTTGIHSSGGSGVSPSASGYSLVEGVAEDGVVTLADRSVTRMEMDGADPVTFLFPAVTKGVSRDFLLRLVITGDVVPEVTFTAPAGETLSLEESDKETFLCVKGINIFAFTETEEGVFVVHRKVVSLAVKVRFDANGGTVDTPWIDCVLGSKYGELPVPKKTFMAFVGWFADDGTEVTADDIVTSSVVKLTARWEDEPDIFAEHICDTGNLVFSRSGDAGWTTTGVSGRGTVARSGAIGNSRSSSLHTKVTGPGTLSFDWKTSTEYECDIVRLYVDGVCMTSDSGVGDWHTVSIELGEGNHEIEWRYQKDATDTDGEDCVWVDSVRWEAS